MEPPFTISADAERYLRKHFDHAAPVGMELALHGSSRMEVRDKQGRLTARYDRDHFFLGASPPEKHVDFVHCDMLGRTLAFHPKVLESLRGHCLTLGKTDYIEGVEHRHDVLIAVPQDEASRQT